MCKSKSTGCWGRGWRGDKTWRANVNTVRNGGTITELIGAIPTQVIGEQLIYEAGGAVVRIEDAHDYPNPHVYPHINYTVDNRKGTLRIEAVSR